MDDRYQLISDGEQGLRQALAGWQMGIWTALPAEITAIDLASMTCECQPTIKAVVVDEQGNQKSVPLPPLVDVPIVFPHGGGFSITFPIEVGDEVLVVISSRCIDAWWQSGGVQEAMEARMHDLSDGFAIPGPWSQPNVPGSISTTDLIIRKDDNSASIAITVGSVVNIYSNTQINVTAPDIRLNGDVTVTGFVHAASVVGGGKDLATHVHTGGTLAFGLTGPPT